MSPKQLAQRLGLPEPELDDIVTQLVEAGDVVRCETAGGALTYCHAEPFAELEERALAYVDRYHADHPRREGVPREELRAQLPRAMPPALFEQVMSALERRRALMTTRDAIARPRHAERVRRNTALDGDIDRRYAEWALTPPKPGDVATDMGADPADARASIDRLLTAGTLVKVKADLLVHRSAMDRLREQLLAHLDANGEITPAEWKSITGASRKYSIPLAEHFDGEKVTLRVGDVRKRRG